MLTINGKTLGGSRYIGPVLSFGIIIYIGLVLSVPGLFLLNKNKPGKDKSIKDSLLVCYIYTIVWILCIILALYAESK